MRCMAYIYSQQGKSYPCLDVVVRWLNEVTVMLEWTNYIG